MDGEDAGNATCEPPLSPRLSSALSCGHSTVGVAAVAKRVCHHSGSVAPRGTLTTQSAPWPRRRTGALESQTRGATRRDGRGAPHGAAMCVTLSWLDGRATAGPRPGAKARPAAHSCCNGEAYRGSMRGWCAAAEAVATSTCMGPMAQRRWRSTALAAGVTSWAAARWLSARSGLAEGGGRAKRQLQADATALRMAKVCRPDLDSNGL